MLLARDRVSGASAMAFFSLIAPSSVGWNSGDWLMVGCLCLRFARLGICGGAPEAASVANPSGAALVHGRIKNMGAIDDLANR